MNQQEEALNFKQQLKKYREISFQTIPEQNIHCENLKKAFLSDSNTYENIIKQKSGRQYPVKLSQPIMETSQYKKRNKQKKRGKYNEFSSAKQNQMKIQSIIHNYVSPILSKNHPVNKSADNQKDSSISSIRESSSSFTSYTNRSFTKSPYKNINSILKRQKNQKRPQSARSLNFTDNDQKQSGQANQYLKKAQINNQRCRSEPRSVRENQDNLQNIQTPVIQNIQLPQKQQNLNERYTKQKVIFEQTNTSDQSNQQDIKFLTTQENTTQDTQSQKFQDTGLVFTQNTEDQNNQIMAFKEQIWDKDKMIKMQQNTIENLKQQLQMINQERDSQDQLIRDLKEQIGLGNLKNSQSKDLDSISKEIIEKMNSKISRLKYQISLYQEQQEFLKQKDLQLEQQCLQNNFLQQQNQKILIENDLLAEQIITLRTELDKAQNESSRYQIQLQQQLKKNQTQKIRRSMTSNSQRSSKAKNFEESSKKQSIDQSLENQDKSNIQEKSLLEYQQLISEDKIQKKQIQQ